MNPAKQLDSIKNNQERRPWIPEKERRWVFIAGGIAFIIVAIGLWRMLQFSSDQLHARSFKFFFQNYGSQARILLFFVLANYVLNRILQKGLVNQWNALKKGMITLFRIARTWHTPVAIVAIALIILHAVGAFLYGFKFDFNNITGLLSLLVLLPVPISGLFRYRRLDRKWHLRLGIGFAVLFLVHSFL